MAVFPDRIVLKNSTDTQAQIIAAIEAGGANEIGQGEIVLGLRAGDTGIYAKDETGAIVSLGGGSSGGGVTSIIPGSGISVDQSTGDVTVTATGTSAGVTAIYAGNGISIDQSTGNVTITATGSSGGGGGGSTVLPVFATATSSGGIADVTGLGTSGLFTEFYSNDADVWVVVYPTAASRTADSSRAYGTPPAANSGVLAEIDLVAGVISMVTPGTSYYNNDYPPVDTIYLAVRDQSGAAVDTYMFFGAYGNQVVTSISGGTFGSGV